MIQLNIYCIQTFFLFTIKAQKVILTPNLKQTGPVLHVMKTFMHVFNFFLINVITLNDMENVFLRIIIKVHKSSLNSPNVS